MRTARAENFLYYGDNLEVLRQHVADECVDLIYLDPPFKSEQDYNVLFEEQNGSRSAAQIKAFQDTWHWDQGSARAYEEIVERGGRASEVMQAFRTALGQNDMLAYLSMMAPRLAELRRVLKPTGSVHLHCDPTASHYLKMLMDAVFGPGNFRNELIWHYGGRGAKAVARQFARNHDVLLFYSKEAGQQFFQRQYLERLLTQEQARKRGFRRDAQGRWFKTAPRGDYTDESVERLEAEDRVHRTSGGRIRVKYFLDERGDDIVENVLVGDTWSDIPDAMHIGKERLGYPTQKPLALLERIIGSCSRPGDVVLDPFCGCGTAVVGAEKLGRHWIGIDITHLAITLVKHRLRDMFGDDLGYAVVGEPVTVPDARALAEQDRYQFQWWALGLVGARPVEEKKGRDEGIDGRLYFHDEPKGGKTKLIVLSVKSGATGPPHVRDLRGVMEREKAEMAALITLEAPTRQMRKEAAAAGLYQSPWGKHGRLQILTVADLLDGKRIDCPPQRQVNVTFKRAPKAGGERPKTLMLLADGRDA